MNTAWALFAKHETPVIPLEQVREDFFPHLSSEVFKRRLAAGKIRLPLVRSDASAKAHLGVHIDDLAAYIDEAREAGRKELAQLTRGSAA